MTHENETALGMDQDTNIALGVSAIPIIKNDILTVAGQMDAAVYDGVLSECEKKLSIKIDEIFNEFNSSNSTDKESLFEQLNTLFEGQSDMQAVITKLRNAIISLETGGEEGSVLSEETIKNVLNAALTTESFWTDDTIGAPSVLGQKIIGLVGEFGEVKASSLKGDTIEGLTLQSHLKDEDDKPLWQINKEGDGHLAGGNISWNDDGTIQIGSETKGLNFNPNGELTFGSDVKLSWGNVDSPSNLATTDDIPDPVSDEHISNITTTTITKDYVESLKVRATDIIGDTITGKTIQSSDNSWKIGKDGDGHLAGGNISWNDDGTIQIGSETKGLNFNSNGELTFGSDVTLNWNKINGTDNVANKSDIPNLDDYATKDYVDQNSGGFTTEIGNNWIKTADVTCENLKVKKLNTAPDKSNNKIEIQGNYIHCLNNDGEKNLIISSNALDTKYINKVLSTGVAGDADTINSDLLNNISLSSDSSYTDCPYSNADIWVSSGTIDSPKPTTLGYILKGSSITCYMGVKACPVKSDKYSSLAVKMLAAADWEITQGDSMTYIVGDSGATRPSSKSGGYVLLYKKNASGNWEDYDQIALTGSWTDAVKPYQSTTSGTAHWKTKGTAGTTITIDESGEYGILLGLEAHSVYAKTSTAIQSLIGYIDVTVKQKAPATYTEIGKDGIVVYDGQQLLKLDSSGVEIKAKTSIGSDKFYGIKVTSSGFKLCKNGTSWVDWNPSYD